MPTIACDRGESLWPNRRHGIRFCPSVPLSTPSADRRSLALLIVALARWCPLSRRPGQFRFASRKAGSAGRARPITDPTQLRRLEFADLRLCRRLPAAVDRDQRRQLLVWRRTTGLQRRAQLAFRRHAQRPGRRSHRTAQRSRPTTLAHCPVAEYLQPFARSRRGPHQGSCGRRRGTGRTAGVPAAGCYGSGVDLLRRQQHPGACRTSRGLSALSRAQRARPMRRRRSRRAAPASSRATSRPCRPSGNHAWRPRAHRAMLHPDRLAHLVGPGGVRLGSGGRAARQATSSATPLVYYTVRSSDARPVGRLESHLRRHHRDGRPRRDRRDADRVVRRPQRPGPVLLWQRHRRPDARQRPRGRDGEHYCYDPTNSDKGQHAYPYRYQMWAYDLNELGRGSRRPAAIRGA